MTTSERILSHVALRLAVLVALGLAGHLPDQRYQPPTSQATATGMNTIYLQDLGLANPPNEMAGDTD